MRTVSLLPIFSVGWDKGRGGIMSVSRKGLRGRTRQVNINVGKVLLNVTFMARDNKQMRNCWQTENHKQFLKRSYRIVFG